MGNINLLSLNVTIIFQSHFKLLNTSYTGFPQISYVHLPQRAVMSILHSIQMVTYRVNLIFLNTYGAVAKAHLNNLETAIHPRLEYFRKIVNSFLV